MKSNRRFQSYMTVIFCVLRETTGRFYDKTGLFYAGIQHWVYVGCAFVGGLTTFLGKRSVQTNPVISLFLVGNTFHHHSGKSVSCTFS